MNIHLNNYLEDIIIYIIIIQKQSLKITLDHALYVSQIAVKPRRLLYLLTGTAKMSFGNEHRCIQVHMTAKNYERYADDFFCLWEQIDECQEPNAFFFIISWNRRWLFSFLCLNIHCDCHASETRCKGGAS